MHVGLFVPCYIDQLYPDVASATLELLEAAGCRAEFPPEQTCCGQPMANSGCWDDARPLAKRFLDIFGPFDHVVCPSGSCTSMVRNHYRELFEGDDELLKRHKGFAPKVLDLVEFLTDVVPYAEVADKLPERPTFPHRVGLHASCHGLRELDLGVPSERMLARTSKVGDLLAQVDGVQTVTLSRQDECCGFGGTFAVQEPDVSAMMGRDRLHDHQQAGAEVITAGDMSCLMHLEGLIRRESRPIKVMHLAQILVGRPLPEGSSLQE